jgi:hypothetical protein
MSSYQNVKPRYKYKQKYIVVKRLQSFFMDFNFFYNAITHVNTYKREEQFDIEYQLRQFYLYLLRFFFLLSNENIINKIYDDFTSCGIIKYDTVKKLPFYFIYY